MSVPIEKWYESAHVRAALHDFLLDAIPYFPPCTTHVLQLLGEPFHHDPDVFFVHLYPNLPERCQAYTVVADCNALPFQAHLFDVVIVVFPSEDMGPYQQWLSEIHRVLSPRGVVAVFNINPLSVEGIIDRIGLRYFPKHQKFVGRKNITQTLARYDLVPLAYMHKSLMWLQGSVHTVPRFMTRSMVDRDTALNTKDWLEGVFTLDIYGYESMVLIAEQLAVG